MEKASPWSDVDPPPEPSEAVRPRAVSPKAVPLLAALRGRTGKVQWAWGYVSAAIGGVITFVLFFLPWLTASGPNGTADSNAFGRIRATTAYLTVWSGSGPKLNAHINGTWAILSSAAIIVTITATVLYLRFRDRRLASITAAAAVANAVLVFAMLLYLNSKGADLKAMTSRGWDFGGQVGSLLDWALGKGKLPIPGLNTGDSKTKFSTAHLTYVAVVAAVLSLASAVAALTQWFRERAPREAVDVEPHEP